MATPIACNSKYSLTVTATGNVFEICVNDTPLTISAPFEIKSNGVEIETYRGHVLRKRAKKPAPSASPKSTSDPIRDMLRASVQQSLPVVPKKQPVSLFLSPSELDKIESLIDRRIEAHSTPAPKRKSPAKKSVKTKSSTTATKKAETPKKSAAPNKRQKK